MNMYNNHPQYNPYGYGYQQQGYNRAPMPGSEITMPIMAQQQSIGYLKGRPVTSVDEARVSQIDLDGSLYIFPDVNNKKIYTKQLNMDGTVAFNIFELTIPVESAATGGTSQYVTREELDAVLASFKETLKSAPNEQQKPATRQFNL